MDTSALTTAEVRALQGRVAVLEEYIARMHLADRGVSHAEFARFKDSAIKKGSPLFDIAADVLKEPRDE
jgi:hypothetical protein